MATDSYKLPASVLDKTLKTRKGTYRALVVDICEVHQLRQEIEAAMAGVEVSDEVKAAIDQAVTAATVRLTPRLHLSNYDKEGKPIPGKNHNLTGRFSVAFDKVKTAVVEGKEEALTQGADYEEVLQALTGE
jgi:predicted RNase H-like HicB family nuclease